MSVEIRSGKLRLDGEEIVRVDIVDNGEEYENGEGNIPNHDKILVVYQNDN